MAHHSDPSRSLLLLTFALALRLLRYQPLEGDRKKGRLILFFSFTEEANGKYTVLVRVIWVPLDALGQADRRQAGYRRLLFGSNLLLQLFLLY